MNKNRTTLLKIIYVAIFTALCFVGTMIMIPVGTSKVHLGNFFCILAGLLCGGVVGGLAGSLGMGLNDIVFGYSYTTYLRTFVLKFLMGFIFGSLFRLLIKKKINGKVLIWISVGLMIGLFSYILSMYFQPESKYSLTLVILTGVLLALILFVAIFSFRFDRSMSCLSFALLVALAVNVIGEFYLRILISLSLDMTYEAALISSIGKLPGALLTSIVTIVFILPLYYPLYTATHRINVFNDLEDNISFTKSEEDSAVKEEKQDF